MAKKKGVETGVSSADIEIELHDIKRRLHANPGSGSSDIFALLASIFIIVASIAGLPLGIIGVIAVARQSANRRKLLTRATELELRRAQIRGD